MRPPARGQAPPARAPRRAAQGARYSNEVRLRGLGRGWAHAAGRGERPGRAVGGETGCCRRTGRWGGRWGETGRRHRAGRLKAPAIRRVRLRGLGRDWAGAYTTGPLRAVGREQTPVPRRARAPRGGRWGRAGRRRRAGRRQGAGPGVAAWIARRPIIWHLHDILTEAHFSRSSIKLRCLAFKTPCSSRHHELSRDCKRALSGGRGRGAN